MKFLIAFGFLAIAAADVSHLKEYLPPVAPVQSLSSVSSLGLPSSEYLPPVHQQYQPAPQYQHVAPLTSTYYTQQQAVPAVTTNYLPPVSQYNPQYTASRFGGQRFGSFQQYQVPQYQNLHYQNQGLGSAYVVPQYQGFSQFGQVGVPSTFGNVVSEPVPAHSFGVDGYSYKDPRF